MNVLTILCQGGWMPVHLSEGWRRLGCSVTEFFYGTHMGKSWSVEGLQENWRINNEILAIARQLKAEGRLDLIFAVIYDDVLNVETARQLRALNVPMVNYHVDMVGQWYRVLRTGKYFDRVACAQLDHWTGLRKAGIQPYYMPMAANPPLEDEYADDERFNFDGVLYLGAPWVYRCQVLSKLAQENVPLRIYGFNWLRKDADPANAQPWRKNIHDLRYYFLPKLRQESWEELVDMVRGRLFPAPPPAHLADKIPVDNIKGSYSSAEAVSLVRGAAINLGFTHFMGAPGTTAERRQVRLREFEIPMAGGFYLTQDCAQLRELFQLDVDAFTWDDQNSLKEKICYYLEHFAERERIAAAVQNYCLKHHTWDVRFRALLHELNLPQPDAPGN